ncbi:unannotated protein [freshwater metagenome]|uniref:Unannotated protein n=1 Tax=freshwater metagenome TaxID=449393 RepID=A0A6J7FL47_9ZZZZ|nr:hypothetical protein [Actinomycetota bacterium]
MIIYCEPCNSNHRVTAGEAERLIYTYAAEAMDARCAPNGKDRVDADRDPFIVPQTCLLEQVAISWDGEGYGEHVAAQVRMRRAHEAAGMGASA